MLKKITVSGVLIITVLALASAGLSAIDKKKKDELYREVEIFSDALAVIQTDYVEEVPAQNLIYGALKGMLSSLDPHSQFLDPESYNELKTDTEGKFGGLGIEITIKDGLLTVVTPIEDTPAWKAGIKANDRIVKINQELTRDMTLTDAVKKLRGKPHEPVDITILRESEKKILEFKIVRDVIKINDIKAAKILEGGIGYVRLAEFRENTSVDLDRALSDLKKQGMNALVMDLRNNPGGLLDIAVKVTEKFIEKDKLIVSTKGRKSGQDMRFVSGSRNPILDMPLVVLINEGSASGSEIVAAALQDYKRAIIVGVKSFGKGSVQTIIPLNDGSALRLTTSKYLSPSGRQIHGIGVAPDITVEQPADTGLGVSYDTQEKEAQYIFDELENKEKQLPQEKALPVAQAGLPAEYKSDNQLMRAIDLLKAVRIYRGIVK